MRMALLMAGLPVVLGAALGMLPAGIPRRVLGAVRTFAVISALAVVFAALLPESLETLGLPALGLVALGMGAPVALGRLLSKGGHRHHGAGVTLGFLGLAGHQLLEGGQIAAAASLEEGWPVILALTAHTAPLVGAVVLGYVAHDGRAVALRRAAVLLLVSLLGAGLGATLISALGGFEAYLQALLAGMLINLLGHDLLADLPQSDSDRWLDLGAAIAGVSFPLLLISQLGHGHAEHDHGPRWLAHANVALALAPWALAGSVLSMGLQRWLCARDGYLGVSLLTRPTAGSPGAVLWARLGGLALSPVVFLVAMGLLGWQAALLIALGLLAAGVLVTPLLGGPDGASPATVGPLWCLPWLLGGVLIAGLIQGSGASGSLGLLGALAVLPVASQGVGVLPLVAALGVGALRPGLAIGFIVAGPLLLPPAFWRRAAKDSGWGRTLAVPLLAVGVAVAVAVLAERLGLSWQPLSNLVPMWVRVGCLGSLSAWMGLQVWERSARRWVEQLLL